MPVSMFGAVMGLGGLALASRVAHVRLGVPAWMGELWALAALVAFVVIGAAYIAKIALHRDAVASELTNPAQSGFAGTIGIATSLIAACLMPYDATAARILWWIAAAATLATQVLILARWLAGGMTLDQVNTGWMIAVVGPIPVAGPGILVGELEVARFFLGTAAVISPFIIGIVFHRTFFGTRMSDALRPTVFIFIVPFALMYAYAPILWSLPSHPVFTSFFDFAVLLTLALVVFAWPALRWPLTPAWWAFTFPLDSLAIAALTYADVRPSPLAHGFALTVWLAASAVVVIVLVRTLLAVRAGAFFIAPKSVTA